MSTAALHHRTQRVTLPRVMRSEWIKFWSLRSTRITLAVGFALVVGLGLIAASMYDPGATADGPGPAISDPTGASLTGVTFGQLAFGTLGVLLMAGEYGSGMIRSSMSAVPRRLPVLWAKIAVFAAISFAVALVASVVAFTAGQALIGDGGASWSDPGVARAVLGTAVVLAGSGVLGVGLGALLRSTPAAISTLFGVMFLVGGIAAALLPESWSSVLQYLPSSAANAFTAVTRSADALDPGAGLTVFLGYLVVVTGLAAWRLERADV